MKILYFSQHRLDIGGAEKNILQLAKNLSKEHELFLASPISDSFSAQLKNCGVKIFEIPQFSKFDLSTFGKIQKIIVNEKIDILHTMDPRARFFAAYEKNKLTRLVHTVHMSPLLYLQNPLKKAAYKILEKELNKRTDKIIFVSESTKNLYEKEKILTPGNYTVIRNGIDLESFKRFLESKTAIKKEVSDKYGLENKKIITFLGRFTVQKGLTHLVEASPLVVKKIPDAAFVLIGGGEEFKSISGAIKSFGMENHFVLPGFQKQEDAYKILASSHVFVLPSIYELMPYVILEAMALGIPIVASDVGGIGEMAKNGRNGFLIESKNCQSLAEKIIKIIEDQNLSKTFSENNLKDIYNFSEQKMVEKTNNMYKELIK